MSICFYILPSCVKFKEAKSNQFCSYSKNIGDVQRFTPITRYTTATLQYNHTTVFDYLGRNENVNTKKLIMNSTVPPSCHFGMRHRSLAVARPTCLAMLAYVDSRTRGTLFPKDRVIVASTYRRSVQFGCYGHRVKQSAVYRHLMTPSWAILLITSHVPNA